MKYRNTQIQLRRSIGGLIALGLSALLFTPSLLSAGEITLKPYNRGRGLQSPVRTPAQHDLSEPTRLSGQFEYSYRSGLTLNGQTVQITSRTSVYPPLDGSGLLPDPADLQGYTATVYGRPGPDGVEAVLLILDANSMYGVSTPNIQRFSLGGASPTPLEMPNTTPQ